MATPSATRVTRRRQRSTRVTVAAGLIVLAALAVAGAASTGSWWVTTLAGAAAVVLGGFATRIVHTELVDSRLVSARDRAAQARAFNELNAQRTTEHEARVTELREQIAARTAEHDRALAELEAALGSSQRRAATATRLHHAEQRRTSDLHTRLADAVSRAETSGLRVSELEHEITYLHAELASVTAAWRAAEQHPGSGRIAL